MKKRQIIYLSILGLIILFAGFFILENSVSNSENGMNFCNFDYGCAKVSQGCCGCNEGGKATAINSAYTLEWNQKMNCSDVVCPQVISDDSSCNKQPACINNVCVLE